MLRHTPYCLFCCLCLISLLRAPIALSQSLSFSMYLPTLPQANTVLSVIAVNQNGESCVYGEGAPLAQDESDFVTKLASDGSVEYSITSLNGSALPNIPIPGQVAIDSQGDCYLLSGNSQGVVNVPVTSGAFQQAPKGTNLWIAKLDGAGNLVYATWLGGSGTDTGSAIATDAAGNAYITGSTTSNDFPTTSNAHQAIIANPASSDAFITVLNPTGTALVYSTYWGGTNVDTGYAIAVDAQQNTYVAGITCSTDFPTVSPFQASFSGCTNGSNGLHGWAGFIIKMDSSWNPVYSTYLGSGGTFVTSIAADTQGSAYVTGGAGTEFPLVNPIQSMQNASAFVSKFNPTGSALVYSTFLGQVTISPFPPAIAVDSSGQAYVAGDVLTEENGGSIPLVSPIQSTGSTCVDCADAFVSVIDGAGSAFSFSTYLGGIFDSTPGIGIDSSHNIYVTGITNGPFPILNAADGIDFPLVNFGPFGAGPPAFQPFVVKINSAVTGNSLSYPTTADIRAFNICCDVGSSSPVFPLLVGNYNASGSIGISNIAATGDFSQTNNCPASLSAATTCEVQVSFTPTAGGERTGTITITDSAPGSPDLINLIGTGLVPQVSLNPTSLTFPSQVVGTTSSPQTVTVSNPGGASLTISNISVSGDFSESNTCSTGAISPSGTCTIAITFSPSSAGTLAGTLTIVDTAAGSPHTLSLTGTGVNPSLGLTVPSGGSAAATVTAGNTATFTLSVGGGGMSGTVSLSCSGTPQGATCNVPATETVSGTSAATFDVSVSTTSRSVALMAAPGGWLWAVALLAAVAVPGSGRRKPNARKCASLLSIMLVLLASSCGGGKGGASNPNGTPAGTYKLVVTATLGPSSQTLTLTLNVQ